MGAVKSFRDDIQGMRAIAVLGVVLFHINSGYMPGGFTGVDIFFVISGFLISSILIDGRDNGNSSWLGFYAGRIRRIVPAYFVMLAIVTAVCFLLMVHSPDFTNFRQSLIAASYFNSASYFGGLGGYFAQASYELPLQHTWTLAVEMQFYLLLPVALIWIPLRINKVIIPLIVVVLLVWSEFRLRASSEVSRYVYFSLIARIPEFLIGVMLALYKVGRDWNEEIRASVSVIGILFIAVAFWTINHTTPFPGAWSLLPTIGTALLIASRGGLLAVVLTCSPMVWLGDISYSLYLWHWPVLAISRYVRMDYDLPLMWLCALIPLMLILSALSFKFVERPLRRLSGRPLAMFIASAVAVAVVAIVPLRMLQLRYVAALTPSDYIPFMADGIYGYKFAYDNSCFGTIKGECLWGDTKSENPRLLILGDSHAAQLASFFDVFAAKQHVGFRLIASSDCPTVPGIDRKRFHREWDKTCAAQTEFAKKYVAESDPIIIAASWEGYDNKTVAEVRTFIEGLPLGKRVVVLSQIPTLKISPIRKIHFDNIGLPKRLYSHGSSIVADSSSKTNDRLKRVFGRIPGFDFLDLSGLPVFEDAPYYKGKLVYFNHNHLNEFGSWAYGSQAAEMLENVLISLSKDAVSNSGNRREADADRRN